MKNKSEYLMKITVIGSQNKYKGQFIRSYAEDKFLDRSQTLGVDITTKKISIGKTHMKLIIVDTMGQEFFGKLRPNYYRGASACIIVFDKSDRKSFDAVSGWLEEFRKHTGAFQTITATEKNIHKISKQLIKGYSLPVALLGINTKEEDVSSDEGKALAELLDLPYFETTFPKFENANEIFEYLAGKVVKL